jgi:hypothetical protein
LIAALLVRQVEADAMICGTYGQHHKHLRYIEDIIGLKAGANNFAAMNMLLHSKGTVFICDTYVNADPTAEQLAEITILAAEEVSRFGITPKIALLSHSLHSTQLRLGGKKRTTLCRGKARAEIGSRRRNAVTQRCRKKSVPHLPQLASARRREPARCPRSTRQYCLQLDQDPG